MCLDFQARTFTSIFEVKSCAQDKRLCLKIEVNMRASEVKNRAYEVKICVYEVKIRPYEVKISAYEIKYWARKSRHGI